MSSYLPRLPVESSVAMSGSTPIWAERGAKVTSGRCPVCDEPVHLVDGAFRHVDGRACTATPERSRQAFIALLAGILGKKTAAISPYHVMVTCDLCEDETLWNMTPTGASVTVDEQWTEGLRPSLLVRDASGRPHCAVEVVADGDVTRAKRARYDATGVPLVIFYAGWADFAKVRKGLTFAAAFRPSPRERVAGRVGYVTGGIHCPGFRHPSPDATCTDCGERTREYALEVVSHLCHRCHGRVPVLDVVRFDGTEGWRFLPSHSNIPPGIDAPAAAMGVTLRFERSVTAGTSYLMHHCPACGAKQGNYFLGSRDLPIDRSVDRQRYQVCAQGHWRPTAVQPWPGNGRSAAACMCGQGQGPCDRCTRYRRFAGTSVIDWG